MESLVRCRLPPDRKEGRSFNDNRVALDDYRDVVGAVQSAEDEFFSELLKADAQAEEKALREKRLAALKAILNAKPVSPDFGCIMLKGSLSPRLPDLKE